MSNTNIDIAFGFCLGILVPFAFVILWHDTMESVNEDVLTELCGVNDISEMHVDKRGIYCLEDGNYKKVVNK